MAAALGGKQVRWRKLQEFPCSTSSKYRWRALRGETELGALQNALDHSGFQDVIAAAELMPTPVARNLLRKSYGAELSEADHAMAAQLPHHEIYRLLTVFYETHNPEKVREVPRIAARFDGKEQVLFTLLQRKYGASVLATAKLREEQENATEIDGSGATQDGVGSTDQVSGTGAAGGGSGVAFEASGGAGEPAMLSSPDEYLNLFVAAQKQDGGIQESPSTVTQLPPDASTAEFLQTLPKEAQARVVPVYGAQGAHAHAKSRLRLPSWRARVDEKRKEIAPPQPPPPAQQAGQEPAPDEGDAMTRDLNVRVASALRAEEEHALRAAAGAADTLAEGRVPGHRYQEVFQAAPFEFSVPSAARHVPGNFFLCAMAFEALHVTLQQCATCAASPGDFVVHGVPQRGDYHIRTSSSCWVTQVLKAMHCGFSCGLSWELARKLERQVPNAHSFSQPRRDLRDPLQAELEKDLCRGVYVRLPDQVAPRHTVSLLLVTRAKDEHNFEAHGTPIKPRVCHNMAKSNQYDGGLNALVKDKYGEWKISLMTLRIATQIVSLSDGCFASGVDATKYYGQLKLSPEAASLMGMFMNDSFFISFGMVFGFTFAVALAQAVMAWVVDLVKLYADKILGVPFDCSATLHIIDDVVFLAPSEEASHRLFYAFKVVAAALNMSLNEDKDIMPTQTFSFYGAEFRTGPSGPSATLTAAKSEYLQSRLRTELQKKTRTLADNQSIASLMGYYGSFLLQPSLQCHLQRLWTAERAHFSGKRAERRAVPWGKYKSDLRELLHAFERRPVLQLGHAHCGVRPSMLVATDASGDRTEGGGMVVISESGGTSSIWLFARSWGDDYDRISMGKKEPASATLEAAVPWMALQSFLPVLLEGQATRSVLFVFDASAAVSQVLKGRTPGSGAHVLTSLLKEAELRKIRVIATWQSRWGRLGRAADAASKQRAIRAGLARRAGGQGSQAGRAAAGAGGSDTDGGDHEMGSVGVETSHSLIARLRGAVPSGQEVYGTCCGTASTGSIGSSAADTGDGSGSSSSLIRDVVSSANSDSGSGSSKSDAFKGTASRRGSHWHEAEPILHLTARLQGGGGGRNSGRAGTVNLASSAIPSPKLQLRSSTASGTLSRRFGNSNTSGEPHRGLSALRPRRRKPCGARLRPATPDTARKTPTSPRSTIHDLRPRRAALRSSVDVRGTVKTAKTAHRRAPRIVGMQAPHQPRGPQRPTGPRPPAAASPLSLNLASSRVLLLRRIRKQVRSTTRLEPTGEPGRWCLSLLRPRRTPRVSVRTPKTKAPCKVDRRRLHACIRSAQAVPPSPIQPGGWVLTELPPTERKPLDSVRELTRGEDLPAGAYGKETNCLFVIAEENDTPLSIGNDVGLPAYAIVQCNNKYDEFRTAGPLSLKSRFKGGTMVRVYGQRHLLTVASARPRSTVAVPQAASTRAEVEDSDNFKETVDAIERILEEQRREEKRLHKNLADREATWPHELRSIAGMLRRARKGRKLSAKKVAATAAQVRQLKWEPSTRDKNERTYNRYCSWATDSLAGGPNPITLDKLTLFVAAYQLVDGNTARGARTVINSVHKWALLHHKDELDITDEQYTQLQKVRSSMEAYDVMKENQALPMTADRIRKSATALLAAADTAAKRRESLHVVAGLMVMYTHGLRGFTALKLQLKHWRKAGPNAYVCTIPAHALPKKGRKKGWSKQVVFWVNSSSDMCAITALDVACRNLYKMPFNEAVRHPTVKERFLFQKLHKSWPVKENKPWHKSTVAKKLRRAAELAGIQQAALVRLHSPRSGLVLDARRRGVDWVDVALILMHADPSTTAKYYYRADPRRSRQTRFQIMGWQLPPVLKERAGV